MEKVFNNPDFYPTPSELIATILKGYEFNGKTVLEPSAGKGNIVDYIQDQKGKVLACEKDNDLRLILSSKCKVIANDFLTLESAEVSHIDYIVMNPPFSSGAEHILKAWDIAPKGCEIIALCNIETINNPFSKERKILKSVIQENGTFENIGKCFEEAERTTGVEVALVKLIKPGESYSTEFEGFFMEDEKEISGHEGIMEYNIVRDLVNRYVAAVKLYDKHLEIAVEMNGLTSGFYSCAMGIEVTQANAPINREEFKKAMQKSGWIFIFNKMNLTKHTTRGLKEDINKFVEKQTDVPFTMKNIYKMLEIVVGTTEQRMDKAILEVFDKLTQHYDENRYNKEGWKTNSHYLLNRKFILPNLCFQDQRWNKGSKIELGYGGNIDLIEDFIKALCYITGDNYNSLGSLGNWIRYRYKTITKDDVFYSSEYSGYYSCAQNQQKDLYEKGIAFKMEDSQPIYGQLFDWAYFTIRCYKKGTMHFEFKDVKLWERLNQRISKIKGYPLYEHTKSEEKKAKDFYAQNREATRSTTPQKANILFKIKIS